MNDLIQESFKRLGIAADMKIGCYLNSAMVMALQSSELGDRFIARQRTSFEDETQISMIP